MHIMGSITEWYSVLNAAINMKAQSIHFISPNVVFMSNGEDYIYTKTTFVVNKAASIPRATYRNMHLYIKKAKKDQQRPNSPFFQKTLSSVTFTPTEIIFDQSEDLTLKVVLPVFQNNQSTEFDIKRTIQTSLHSDSPHLTLTDTQVSWIHSLLMKHKKKYRDKVRNSADNAIRIENEQLVLYLKGEREVLRKETRLTESGSDLHFPDVLFTFSDRALYLFRWMSKTTRINKVHLIPRNNHCIVEGSGNELLLKVRAGTNNDLDLARV